MNKLAHFLERYWLLFGLCLALLILKPSLSGLVVVLTSADEKRGGVNSAAEASALRENLQVYRSALSPITHQDSLAVVSLILKACSDNEMRHHLSVKEIQNPVYAERYSFKVIEQEASFSGSLKDILRSISELEKSYAVKIVSLDIQKPKRFDQTEAQNDALVVRIRFAAILD